jgi:hypothetical protein
MRGGFLRLSATPPEDASQNAQRTLASTQDIPTPDNDRSNLFRTRRSTSGRRRIIDFLRDRMNRRFVFRT